ncbi:hypothetical protein LAUMK13_05383 [Mycobacterium innocens]|uniref:Uncharacterized protein n=1 Tax=Mycobacterium innocens TaxID=2341083 RepID=A0A498QK19_9MYCO|nr:hypothetical protein LAUMK13_05383 [Mycobacterium innocens]
MRQHTDLKKESLTDPFLTPPEAFVKDHPDLYQRCVRTRPSVTVTVASARIDAPATSMATFANSVYRLSVHGENARRQF